MVVMAFKIAGSRAARQPHVIYQPGAIRMKPGGKLGALKRLFAIATLRKARRDGVLGVLENVPGLTPEVAADRLEGTEPDRLCLARFEDREVGHRDLYRLRQFRKAHLAPCQRYVQSNNDRHAR